MRRRRLLTAAGAGLAALALRPGTARAYGDSFTAVGNTLDELRARGSAKVAWYTDFFPFSYQTADGWTGIDVDLARHVTAALGVSLQPFPFDAGETVEDDLRNVVWRGSLVDKAWANLLIHAPVDRALMARNDLVVLMGAYHVESLAVAIDPERVAGGDPSLSLLEGHRLAVEQGSIADLYLASTQGGRFAGSLTRHRRPEDAIAALRDGEADAVMGPRSQLEAHLGEARERFPLLEFPLPGLPVPRWPVGFAARINARDVATAVEEAVGSALNDGTVARIFAAHGVTHRAPEPA